MRTLLITMLLLISIAMYSQYESIFGDSVTTFNIIPHGICDAVTTEEIVFRNDTVINSKTYKYSETGLFFYNDTIFVSEDTVSGKIWLFNRDKAREYIIADFSLNKGEAFLLYSYNFNDSTSIKVDSVYNIDGRKHIRFENKYIETCVVSPVGLELIEGIGSNAGILYNSDHTISSLLLCLQKDDEKVYSFFDDKCFYESVGILDSKDAGVFVYPNPVIDFFNIIIDSGIEHEYCVTIYNSNGRLLIEDNNIGSTNNYDMLSFDSGIYYYTIKAGAKIIKSGKIIKE